MYIERETVPKFSYLRLREGAEGAGRRVGWDEGEEAFPLPGIEGGILEKVIEYCNHHAGESQEDKDEAKKDDEPTGFDQEFLRDMDQSTLFKLILVRLCGLALLCFSIIGTHTHQKQTQTQKQK